MNQKTRENLELNRNSDDGKNSAQYFGHWMSVRLFMGKRLLAQWINEPLYNKLEIEKDWMVLKN